ncbi:hypothetical protein C8250_029075 [Streptomyces sp. So13.3]|uniref:hypothetical protein n=1 Tax=Streptomyces sp. So13.3 TaxID=2136173 RepID=UPI0011064501|nr:hypothetical protein [Streptomyces sp. So13.3]QNA75404.1 hypothetical protein C8250_029075 [Streptomyces sp. So13.3]
MTPDELERQVETLDLINNELAARLARQAESGSKIDTKAVLLVGFAATAAQFLASRHAQAVLAGLAFGAYAVAFGFGVSAFRVAAYKDVEPRPMFDRYGRRSKAEALVHLASARVKAFEKNADQHECRAKRWWISLAALTLGLILSVAAIVQTG